MPTARWFAFFAPIAAALAAASACGSRTGLLVPPPHDASSDVEPDVAPDVGPDAPEEPGMDAAEEDALPGLDVIEEPINICPDAGSTLIYLITTQNVLLSFYPPTATFAQIGTISCPDPGSNPFSMAVDRTSGLAYVVFTPSGNLWRVTTTSPPQCMPTPFAPGQGGYPTLFGMGFAANPVDASTPETLYVAGDPGMVGTGDGILASIDTNTFALRQVGPFFPSIAGVELTGTGSGELFAFYGLNGMQDSAIGQIDRATAQVTGQANLPGLAMGSGWAFAFWGGDFYTFTSPPFVTPSSLVTRYRPSDGSITQITQTPGLTIVGAGVSTCAPQQ
ncbi:MAG TPA: hypothetical protein VF765_38260 [Polyangiaceae bacterium]